MVARGVIASAEKTSLSAMRTGFYEITRKWRVKPVGFLPWATIGCSAATYIGLLEYGDGIECAAESLLAAPSIASLGGEIDRSIVRASVRSRRILANPYACSSFSKSGLLGFISCLLASFIDLHSHGEAALIVVVVSSGRESDVVLMALSFVRSLQSLWPFSRPRFDDLKASNELVRKLPVPEQTKQFVFAVREPESRSVVYVLAVQNLSERSARDAECLIREVRPGAVVAQVDPLDSGEVQPVECVPGDGVDCAVPTSALGVLRRCFVDKLNKEKYENVAGGLVLREIFGIGFHGHFFAAKKAAHEVGSSFVILESPFVNCSSGSGNTRPSEADCGQNVQGLVSSLVPQRMGSGVYSSLRRFCLNDDVQSQMVRIVSSNLDPLAWMSSPLSSDSNLGPEKLQTIPEYEAPPFAQSIYPLLEDLHNIFTDIPSIGRALVHAQQLLSDVNRGQAVDSRTVSEVYSFRIAVEGLRIALNTAARLPSNKMGSGDSSKIEFADLPHEEKAQVLFAQALRSQAKKFKTIVAVVDASALAGLRKHWNTPIPLEVKDLVEELATDSAIAGEISNRGDKKRMLSGKPVVAVGAGATAILGASSLSKVLPVSTFMKLVTFKVPASFKLMLSPTQKALAMAFGKSLGPSKLAAPGLASSAAKTSALKVTASAEKIRVVAHGVIASAEKTSLSAMRTAFYEIMRKRRIKPVGFLPWATFGCSVATCTSLLVYGDGIECAAESLPAAPSIASLGRGIQSLQQASQAVVHANGSRIQKSIESLMHKLKKVKFQ
ncbi:hypothetical protein NL676_019321 [Syzygium grande]|nr:hypothetical protein NL676_019321 [Syzygium grande]